MIVNCNDFNLSSRKIVGPKLRSVNRSFSMGNRMGRVKLRINFTRVFGNFAAISENTSDINP